MGKTAQPGSTETPVKSRARRATVPPARTPSRSAGSSTGSESGLGKRSRPGFMYLFVCCTENSTVEGEREGELPVS